MRDKINCKHKYNIYLESWFKRAKLMDYAGNTKKTEF